MIKISDGKHRTYDYRKELRELGLNFKRTDSGGYWWTDDDSRQRELLNFCNKRKLIIVQEDSRYTRSANYRTEFIRHNKGYKGNRTMYHCAYCGRKIKKDEMQVDHLIAVNKVKKHILPRLFMHLCGIHNVNDTKNLVASCSRCNQRKSDNQGFWLVRGFFGRSIWFWRIFHTIIAILVIFVIYMLISQGYLQQFIENIRNLRGVL